MADPREFPDGTPSLSRAINLSIDGYMANVHTCMPGRVVAVDEASGTIDVKPLLKRKYVHETEARELPVISRVPFVDPSMGSAWVKFPVAVGYTVLILFAERSIDLWMEKGGVIDPADSRKFDLSDAIAIPGLRPRNAAISRKGATTSLEVHNGGAWLELTAQGRVKLGNEEAELLDVLGSLIENLIALQVLTSSGPAGLTPASAAQLQGNLVDIERIGT